jgi:hypothetical protein
MNDAFEAAFLDSAGNSLVHTIQPNRDAFFNLTERQMPALGAEASTNGTTVNLDLSGIAQGTTGTLLLRLVNNDQAGSTSVHITCVELAQGSTPVTSPVIPAVIQSAVAPVDFSTLTDVTPSFAPAYGQTSFDNASSILYAGLAIKDAGTYPVDGPLLVGVRHITSLSVHVRDADGTLPDGTPY